MAKEIKRTAVHSWHETNGAKMVPFAGWHMPLTYPTGAIAEHHATRQSAGLFDISHMGRVTFHGPDAAAFLDDLITSDILGLATGMSTYGLLCSPDGAILDDVFTFRIARDRFVVVVNAANRGKDLDWFRTHIEGDVELADQTEETSMFALQGPRAIDSLRRSVDVDVRSLARFGILELTVGGNAWWVSRTGYTGEDGVEIVVPAVDSLAIWTALVRPESVTAAGLAARDSLRFEPGFALYGHEIDETRTPVEARLTWACHLERPFVGRDAILERKKRGVDTKLSTFVMKEKAVPRQGQDVVDGDGNPVGSVVTGMYAPTVDAFAGNAYLPLEYAKIGSTIAVKVRRRSALAEVVKRPLYRPAYRG
jgi:glycine cleavage system T protein